MTEEKYIQLIHRSLQGSLTEAENTQFRAWLAKDVVNQDMAKDIAKGWMYSGSYSPSVPVDVDRAFGRFEKAMDTVQVAPVTTAPVVALPTSGRRNWLSNLSRMAAAILLLAGAFWGWNVFSNAAAPIQVLATEARMEVTLPDQSTIILNKGATLSYDAAFQPRQLTLTGEAFFEVTHDPASPFIIFTKNTTTKVLGTSFNIKNDNSETIVTVFTGKVSFADRHQAATSLILLPKEKGTYLTPQKQLSKSTAVSLQTLNWQKQSLQFQDEPLRELFPALAAFYQVDFKLSNTAIKNCTFTGKFQRGQLSEALEGLSFGLDLDFAQEGEDVIVKGEGCE